MLAAAKRATGSADVISGVDNNPETIKHLVACLKEAVEFVRVLSSAQPELRKLLASTSADVVQEVIMLLQLSCEVRAGLHL